MKIPREFVIHGHTIHVYIYEKDGPDNRFGYYDCVREEIVVYKSVKVDNELVELNEAQMISTFLHELTHCIQWHVKGQTDEWEAQSYAGLIFEFLQTKKDD